MGPDPWKSSRHWARWAGPWVGVGLGVGGGRFFEAGEVRLAILSLLGEAPKHGYELIKAL